ncbi:hypothetical protein PF010_g5204 [Phytophthora fragariae]|uniref:Uncharacterized protein n=1 Tax=Phytophthora fragariae TaxID=53985 RepID=A0A6G0LP06_9STRA|nr:hypothetical protein PF010_g5204 [Phytophthora fragariae]KAE9330459.1 hypothetical protein PF008_g15727 [Phytophthora fragariae]
MGTGYTGDEDESAGSDVWGTLKYLEAARREVSSCGERCEASSQHNLPQRHGQSLYPHEHTGRWPVGAANKTSTARDTEEASSGCLQRRAGRRQRDRVAGCYFGTATGGWLGVGRYPAW